MNDILNEIEQSQKVLLHCHPNPDPDSVGSTLALKRGLEKLGKEVTLIQGDSEIPKEFKFPGVESILKKSIEEVDLKSFDTFLILDSGSKEMISRRTEIEFPESLNTVVIDHHISNIKYAKGNWVDSTYSSTAEMVYDLLKELKVEIDHDIALNIIMGIYTDTGGFRYGTNPIRSLKIAAALCSFPSMTWQMPSIS